MFHDILFLILGLALIMAGGNYITDGAESIARRFHISPLVIVLTVVAFGSSMPDLATSAIAAVKRQPGIALGNVVGACIFNIFFIIGACATCRPLETGNISAIDFGVLTAAGTVLLIFGLWKKHKITRLAGGCLVAAYIAYMAYVIIFNSKP